MHEEVRRRKSKSGNKAESRRRCRSKIDSQVVMGSARSWEVDRTKGMKAITHYQNECECLLDGGSTIADVQNISAPRPHDPDEKDIASVPCIDQDPVTHQNRV